MKTRHTMGNDWGGRRASNPKGTPRVTAQQVKDAATKLGIDVRKGDFSRVPGSTRFFHSTGWAMWWKFSDGQWRTFADTNYHALEHLNKLTPSP